MCTRESAKQGGHFQHLEGPEQAPEAESQPLDCVRLLVHIGCQLIGAGLCPLKCRFWGLECWVFATTKIKTRKLII